MCFDEEIIDPNDEFWSHHRPTGGSAGMRRKFRQAAKKERLKQYRQAI